MCDLSLRRISIPLFFFASEIGGYALRLHTSNIDHFFTIGSIIAATVIQGQMLVQPARYLTRQNDNIANIVDGTVSVVTAITTALGTFIICRRIISSTDREFLSDKRYRRITWILIESASMYSVTSILSAISDFLILKANNSNDLTILGIQAWLATVATVVTVSAPDRFIKTPYDIYHSFVQGIAPTLTVAQVCINSALSRNATSVHAHSGLDFRVQSTVHRDSHPSSAGNIFSMRNDSAQMAKMEEESV